jgi:aminopeptidase N
MAHGLEAAMKRALVGVILVAAMGCAPGNESPAGIESRQPYDTGGPLKPEQAAYDVLHYDLSLRIDPATRSLEGELGMRARAVQPLDRVVMDLDPVFQVDGAWVDPDLGRVPALFHQRGAEVSIELDRPATPGETVEVVVAYSGKPREAPMPPWWGGFSWAESADGSPWIGVSCQIDGADVWWPCKDHPSDEPDEGVGLHFTVPKPLTVVSNGRSMGVTDENDGWWTHHWRVGGPINLYNVTVNVGPFEAVERQYIDVLGDARTLTWWALPESVDRAERLLEEFALQLRFFEEELGPYPFRGEKCSVVDTPYLAMEHQTNISLGLDGDVRRGGFSYILLHELGHEWWGNLVSAADWRDFWLHEGFDGYMEARYAERLGGRDAYLAYMDEFMRPAVLNQRPPAPAGSRWIRDVFVSLADDADRFAGWDADAYTKGALVLHALRYLVGDETFTQILRRWAYPDPSAESRTDGSVCRSVTTEQFIEHCEQLSGRELDWFFDGYLRQARLPVLESRIEGDRLMLQWRTEGSSQFPMPIDVAIGADVARVEAPDGTASVVIPAGVVPVVDPEGWVLRTDASL